jgi:hypothetical protein
MKSLKWTSIPAALLMVGAMSTAVLADNISTPLSNPVTVSGRSGGSESSSCGNISSQPAQVIHVTSAFTSLEFKLEGAGEPTLWLTGSNGFTQCVIADNLSNGSIDVPVLWDEGTYSIYVGDRSGGTYDYTLTISQ